MVRHLRMLLFLYLVLASSVGFAKVALFIIDMQPKFSERGGYHELRSNPSKIQSVLERQVQLIRLAKEADVPVVFIEYRNFGSTSDVLTREVIDYENTKLFEKANDGMFSDTRGVAEDIARYLEARDITDLIITGANGGACVRCSIQGALDRGYRVWADIYGIADFNHSDFILPYRYGENHFILEPSTPQQRFQQHENPEVVEALLATTTEAEREALIGSSMSWSAQCRALFAANSYAAP